MMTLKTILRNHRILSLSIGTVILVLMAFSGYWGYRILVKTGGRTQRVMQFLLGKDRGEFQSYTTGKICQNAALSFPTDGYIGFFWDDSFRPFHRHQGLDIFGGTAPGIVPVYAASDGYLTRESNWKSSLIIRVPEDPLHPGSQIWLYYTHLAFPDGTSTIIERFPAGSKEMVVKSGELLGYQGNYSGDPLNPVGVHLHFSVVKDDGKGHYRNELLLKNTYDPLPYFGLVRNKSIFNSGVVCSSDTDS